MKVVVARPPQDFSLDEIDDFVAFVLAGGEVTPNGLREHVTNSKCIAFLRSEGSLLGVAGLKRPRSTYRERVQRRSEYSLPEGAFPFELGWVFILPSARGANLSLPLCKPLFSASGKEGVFATSKAKNPGMHATLTKLGFERAGNAWRSKQSEDDLLLFVRNAL
jgi:hypothetical protein